MSALPTQPLGTTEGAAGKTVLALNCGSSSLKISLYRAGASQPEQLMSETVPSPDPAQAFACVEKLLRGARWPRPAAIGHRIVHGGSGLQRHCRIDATVLRQLEAATLFAPLHLPQALSLVRYTLQRLPDCPQVACMDTAFHRELPDVARVLPVDRELRAAGIRRYGFHGLSCESILHQLGPELPRRLIIVHLGNGASVTAVRAGKSIDTSMGFTPSGGMIMGTRSGDLDPGVIVHLLREQRFDAATLDAWINQRAGLLGISGVSSDMRRLHEAAETNPDAQLAVAMFCYSARKHIAGMIAALDGVDQIVFTGGIGENDAQVRAMICAGFSWLGLRLDPERNRRAQNPLSNPASSCIVSVLRAQEDVQIALHTLAVLAEVRQ